MVFFRFLQGIGGGALLSTSQAILFETFSTKERGKASGIFSLGIIIGPSIGPILGGYIVDNLSWPWIFYVNIPIGLTAAALENQLADVALNGQSPPEQYRASILICKKAMNKMKRFVTNYAFENTAEEIHFFKEVKPLFYSKYIYFINVYNYLMQCPAGGEDAVKSYINFNLTDLQRFFDNNKAFYQYYRSGGTQMDEIYFTRGGFDVQMELEDFEEDEQYSTSHDHKLSKIIANEKFQEYLKLEYARIGNEQFQPVAAGEIFPFAHPNWTATPTDAIELIYSLKASGSVNNGNINVSELVGIFEFVFQMEIKESYHKIIDIGRRKKTIPLFLNKLIDGLLRLLNDKLSA